MVKLGLIVTCYNSEKFVPQFLEWVRGIANEFEEIVIVDDCSSDRTVVELNALKDLFSHIKVLVLNNNSGRPAVPRNTGLQNINCDRVVFLDIDDMLSYDYIRQIKNLNSDNIITGIRVNDVALKNLNNCTADISKRLLIPSWVLNYKNLVTLSGSSIPLSIARRFEFQNSFLEDWLYWLDISKDVPSIEFMYNSPISYYSGITLSPRKVKQVKRVWSVIGVSRLPVYFCLTLFLRLCSARLRGKVSTQS